MQFSICLASVAGLHVFLHNGPCLGLSLIGKQSVEHGLVVGQEVTMLGSGLFKGLKIELVMPLMIVSHEDGCALGQFVIY